MARKARVAEATEEVATETAVTEEAAVTETEATTAETETAEHDRSDPFYAEFTVTATLVQNAVARERLGTAEDGAVDFAVIRYRKGVYQAVLAVPNEEGGVNHVSGKESKNPDVAVRYCIKAAGMRDAEFMFDAAASESVQAPFPATAGDNQPDKFFFDEECEIASRLAAVEAEVREADTLMNTANKSTTEAWLSFGRAYNKAKAIFAEAGYAEDGEDPKRSRAAWGYWLRSRFAGSENVKAILESKNAAGQAGFFATAPMEVIEASGAGTASTFERKANEACAEFAGAVAESVLAARAASENADKTLTEAQAYNAAAEKLITRETAYTDAFAAWQSAAAKAAEKGKSVDPFTESKKRGPLLMVRWLFDTAGEDFGNSKIGRAIAKAWDAEVNKPSEEEKTAAEAEKATAAIAKTFADMSVSDAAAHLLKILVSHAEPEEVMGTLGDMLVEYIAKKESATEGEAETE